MKWKISVVLIVLAIVLIITNLISIDYRNFTWTNGLSSVISIIGMIFLIISLIIQIRYDNKNKQT